MKKTNKKPMKKLSTTNASCAYLVVVNRAL